MLKSVKYISTIILGFIIIQTSFSQPVNRALLDRTAERVMYKYFPNGIRNIEAVRTIGEGQVDYIYVFDLDPEGWILLSADMRTDPLLGFSYEGKYRIPLPDMYDPQYGWLQTYTKQIVAAIRNKNMPIHKGWKEILEGSKKSAEAGVTVEDLLDVTWDQDKFWNIFCPEDETGPGGYAYVGCVGVSMAQAMSLFEYPDSGIGEYSYVSENYGTQYVNYGNTAYLWDSMSVTSPDSNNALLLYHTAVSVDMDFGPDGSGAFTRKAPGAMKRFFGYSENMTMVHRYADDEQWKDLLINELVNGRPIIYSGDANDGQAGHAFNIDGVINSQIFHLNWGWQGSNNGYFKLDDLTPGTHDFTFNHKAVVGIQPLYYPTDIILSDTIVPVDMPAGTEVGKLNVVDEATDNVYVCSLACDSSLQGEELLPDYYIEGDTILRINRSFSEAEKGLDTIEISVTDQFGHTCTNEVILNITDESSQGTSSRTLFRGKEGIRIYPNPVNSILFVKNTLAHSNISGHVRIHSILGNMVYHTETFDLESGIDVSGLAPGIYILELNTSQQKPVKIRFIKE